MPFMNDGGGRLPQVHEKMTKLDKKQAKGRAALDK
jgi:hypothetical protein